MGNPPLTPGDADWLGGRKIIGLDAGGNFRVALIGNEGQLVRMAYPHWEVHHGNHWSAFSREDAVANDASIDFLLIVGATKVPHITLDFKATAGCWVDWYVGPTTSANGTKVKILRNNAASTRVAQTAIYKGPTVTDAGELAAELVIPGGARNSTSAGSSVGHDSEFNFGLGVKYLFRITNKGGAGVVASIGFSAEWYEEEPFVDG